MDKQEILITEAVLGQKPRREPESSGTGAKAPGTALLSVPGGGKKKKSRRRLRRFFLWFVTAGIMVLGSAAAYLYYNQDEIKRLVIDEINKNLQAPISVRNVRLGMWREFPMISVSFEGISGQGTGRQDTEMLFEAESIALTFSLSDILKKRYIVREILIRGGDFNLKHYGNGAYNYIIWKKRDSAARPLSFHLRRILLRNTLVRFRDIPARHDFQLLARNVTAKGDLYENGQEFHLKGPVGIHAMKASGFVFLEKRDGALDIRFSNDQKEKRFVVQRGVVGIGNMDFSTQGYVCYDKQKPYMDFVFRGKDLRMESLFSLLPPQRQAVFNDYSFKGNIAFTMTIRGDYTRNPLSVSAHFDYRRGKIRHKASEVAASDVDIRGSFTNGKGKKAESSRLLLDTISARLPSGTVSGRFSIDNFRVPTLRYEGVLSAELSELQPFFRILPAYVSKGLLQARISFQNTFPSLYPKEWKSHDLAHAEMNGYMRISGFELECPNGKTIATDSTALRFSPKAIRIAPFIVRTDSIEIQARVFIENWLSYMLFPGQNLYVAAGLKSRSLEGEALSAWIGKEKDDSRIYGKDRGKGPAPARRGKNLQEDLYADIDIEVDALWLADMKIEYLKTLLRYTPENMVLENLKFSAFQGYFEGTAAVSREKEGVPLHLQGKIDRMDIGSCFRAFRNFGQQQLTYRNIGGVCSADFRMGATYLPTEHKIDPASLRLWTRLNITDGVLQNMESLRKISRFTGEDDLQDIHFADLRNVIEISDRRIRIPEMLVSSSAADLTFSGTHTFDNEVDYLVNIELSDLLSRRRAQRVGKEEEFGVVTGGKSRVRLPLQIKGIWPDVEVKYAFSQARKGAGERLRENRTELKEALQEELAGLRKKREAQKEKKAIEKRKERGEFIIEVDEPDLLRKKNHSDTVRKTDSIGRRKKYKTEDDFRLEFEDD